MGWTQPSRVGWAKGPAHLPLLERKPAVARCELIHVSFMVSC